MARATLKTYAVSLGGRNFTVLRKRVKNMTLRIKKDGLYVTAPVSVSEERLYKFIEKNLAWVEKHLKRIEKNKEKIYLLGQAYDRVDEYSLKASAEFFGGVCYLRGKDDKEREKALMAYYKKTIEPLLPPLFVKWQKETGLYVRKVLITSAKTYLGKCEIGERRIRISCRLAAKDQSVIDYVVLHEICHLRYAGHQKNFYSLVQRYMPDYKTRVKIMRGR